MSVQVTPFQMIKKNCQKNTRLGLICVLRVSLSDPVYRDMRIGLFSFLGELKPQLDTEESFVVDSIERVFFFFH